MPFARCSPDFAHAAKAAQRAAGKLQRCDGDMPGFARLRPAFAQLDAAIMYTILICPHTRRGDYRGEDRFIPQAKSSMAPRSAGFASCAPALVLSRMSLSRNRFSLSGEMA